MVDSYLHHQAHADPNAADVSGEPPLIEAACYGDLEAINLGGCSRQCCWMIMATQLLGFVKMLHINWLMFGGFLNQPCWVVDSLGFDFFCFLF